MARGRLRGPEHRRGAEGCDRGVALLLWLAWPEVATAGDEGHGAGDEDLGSDEAIE